MKKCVIVPEHVRRSKPVKRHVRCYLKKGEKIPKSNESLNTGKLGSGNAPNADTSKIDKEITGKDKVCPTSQEYFH